jgi:hypothetical protein
MLGALRDDLIDGLRPPNPARDARDAYVAEHMEIGLEAKFHALRSRGRSVRVAAAARIAALRSALWGGCGALTPHIRGCRRHAPNHAARDLCLVAS